VSQAAVSQAAVSQAAVSQAAVSMSASAWAPGYGRRPAPGTQKEAGALVEAWVKTGAVCPN
ncbi:MAG: hypothetical protein WCB61_22065, partial [Pseudolabrys sp.]